MAGDSYPGGTGALTFAQIEQLWTSNGGNPQWAPLMAAIAEAESSGHPGVLNDNPGTGDYSVGLWQINYYANLLTPRSQRYGSPSTLWNDPNAQARAAVDLFANGQGASNWQGDAAYQAWKANGAPMFPTQSQLASFGAPTGGGGGGTYTAPDGSSSGSGVSGGFNPNAPVLQIPHVGTVIDAGQALSIKGWFLMISGGVIGAVGLAVVLTAFGLESKAAKVVMAVTPTARAAGAASGAASAATQTAERAQEPPTAGRRESREIERRYQETERQQGPIGPRGGNPTANRVAQRERRGRTVAGARRRQAGSRERTPAPEPFE